MKRFLTYISEHKKPVTSSKMAKYFIASESSVKQALANMVKKGVAEVVPNSKPFLYRLK
jgi:Mn-dependent DtxR family transcriptional regulator